MRRILRLRVASWLTMFLLFAGAFPTTGAVLCIGPGHHCHSKIPWGELYHHSYRGHRSISSESARRLSQR